MLPINKQFLEACKVVNLEQIKKALQEGANINARDDENNNGLQYIAKIQLGSNEKINRQNLGLIETTIVFLLNNGINYKAKNSNRTFVASSNHTPVERLINRLIEDFEFEAQYSTKKLLAEQIELLKTVNQKLDNQSTTVTDVLKQLQQPLDFEKQKREFLERENQLLQKQLSLQMDLEKLRQENYELKQCSAGNEQDTSSKKSSLQLFR